MLALVVQYVLVWNDAPRYMHPEPNATHDPMGNVHELAVYRRIAERGEFIEIEPVDATTPDHCFYGDGFGLAVRFFVRREALALVTPRELTVKLADDAQVKLGAGVAVFPRKAGGNEAVFDGMRLPLPDLPSGALSLWYSPTRRFDQGRKSLGRVEPLPLDMKAVSAVGSLRGLSVTAQKPHGDSIAVTAATPCAEFRFVAQPDRINARSAAAALAESGVVGVPAQPDFQPGLEVRKGAKAYWLDGEPAGKATKNLGFLKMEKLFRRLCVDNPFPVCFDEADVARKPVRPAREIYGPPIKL